MWDPRDMVAAKDGSGEKAEAWASSEVAASIRSGHVTVGTRGRPSWTCRENKRPVLAPCD